MGVRLSDCVQARRRRTILVDVDDAVLRAGVFQWLAVQSDGGERPLSWAQLTSGYSVGAEPVQLIGQRGIWKPKQLELPIAITTTAPKSNRPAPYEDHVDHDTGLLRYAYQGSDPNSHDNRWLRACMQQRIGLVYFHGVEKGWYLPTWPVYVVEDHPEQLSVSVMLANPASFDSGLSPDVADAAEARFYHRMTKHRLDQAAFRSRVMRAYQRKCSVCSLQHEKLLDAAHIRPHRDGGSSATSNGLSLCKIHHAAFDHHILGIDPDLKVRIREDVLDEVDGPMLRHGLQEMEGKRLFLPQSTRDRPSPDVVEERYELFRRR